MFIYFEVRLPSEQGIYDGEGNKVLSGKIISSKFHISGISFTDIYLHFLQYCWQSHIHEKAPNSAFLIWKNNCEVMWAYSCPFSERCNGRNDFEQRDRWLEAKVPR